MNVLLLLKELIPKRRTGRTTKQLETLSQNAVFVWLCEDLHYPSKLALKIGRKDIVIVGPSWLSSDKWRELNLSGITIDHAAKLTQDQYKKYLVVQSRLK